MYCTKAESYKTRWTVLSKTKTCRIITEAFHFDAICFALRFFKRAFFKTLGEPLHVLTLHPKLIFRGSLQKALMVPEDSFYQTKYFAKIFPIQLAFMLQIHFYLHFQESV